MLVIFSDIDLGFGSYGFGSLDALPYPISRRYIGVFTEALLGTSITII
jgi:hypothetical protein